ncbi:fibronectin type III domain-containing protein [Tenacibaculum sp. M341]|uniref:fibronectin type III domain-containing protein n=1 Tax=Tenacibaculum sp. M341 TaxID=2530339 RepID=UPI001046FE75|nr:fibronectin type III domain-containing protein [Tenacibaculum sp. M341]TCI90173.1 T9SS type A sorting domain-containing protein [Tenacibaculum sp. M341]
MKKIYFLLLILCFKINSNASNDKYRLTLRNNPATSIVIGWNQILGTNPKVYYGTKDNGVNYNLYTNSKTPDRIVSYKGMNNHFVRLTNLQPNTSYYFVIKDSEGTSRRLWFKTAPANNDRMSFIAGGDSRNNREPRQNANRLVAKLKPHAVLFGGDMTDDDTNSQWQNWFNDWQLTIANDGRMFPIVAARGNHEDSNNTIYNLFDVPSSRVYYAITFGENLVRAYTLNTEISISGDQTNWLRNDLTANESTIWKIAQYHKPMRPHTFFKLDGFSQYSNWASLFYEKDVKLVVECDAHTVKTTWPVKPSYASGNEEGFIRDDKNGTVYVGEGCWGAPLRSNDDVKKWTRSSGRFNQFKWIFIDEDKIETRTIQVDNALEVGEVSNNNVFQIPTNLDVWNPANGSVVTINKEGNVDTTPDVKTIEITISNGRDDVEENKNGNVYTYSSDLELVYDSRNKDSYQTIGLRYRNVSLPKNVTITNAYIQFTADESNTESTELEIALENTASAAGYSNSNNVSRRNFFTNRVNWKPAAWEGGQTGSAQKTPNLKNLIQELVNKNDWNQGNSLSFAILGKGNSLTSKSAKRVADSYERSASKAPKLIVSYTTKSGNICNGVQNWQSNVNYTEGQKVVYEGNLFERTASEWNFLGACSNIASKNSEVSLVNVPPIFSENDLEVYPNPFIDQINITVNNNYFNKPLTIELFNINGQQVYKEVFKVKEASGKIINPAILAKGMYFLTIKSDEKIIKQSQLIKE